MVRGGLVVYSATRQARCGIIIRFLYRVIDIQRILTFEISSAGFMRKRGWCVLCLQRFSGSPLCLDGARRKIYTTNKKKIPQTILSHTTHEYPRILSILFTTSTRCIAKGRGVIYIHTKYLTYVISFFFQNGPEQICTQVVTGVKSAQYFPLTHQARAALGFSWWASLLHAPHLYSICGRVRRQTPHRGWVPRHYCKMLFRSGVEQRWKRDCLGNYERM